MVMHSCGHVHAYTVPGWLGEHVRWQVVSELSQECCPHCALEENVDEPTLVPDSEPQERE